MPNPYESPTIAASSSAEPPPKRKSLWWSVVTWFFLGYPVWFHCCFYGCWLMAWMVLGHRPRAWLDDPASIGLAVTIPSFAAVLFLLGFPLGLFGGFFVLARGGGSLLRVMISAAVLLGVWVLAFVLLRWDPLSVGTWYMD